MSRDHRRHRRHRDSDPECSAADTEKRTGRATASPNQKRVRLGSEKDELTISNHLFTQKNDVRHFPIAASVQTVNEYPKVLSNHIQIHFKKRLQQAVGVVVLGFLTLRGFRFGAWRYAMLCLTLDFADDRRGGVLIVRM